MMGALPMHVPDFKTLVMPAIVAALEEWKQEAERSELLPVYLYTFVLGKWEQETMRSALQPDPYL